MEYAVCAASSDSEGATDFEDATTELEEERVASNTDQQGPLFEVAAESTSDAQASSGFAFINKAAPPRKRWDYLDVLKVEAGEKPNHKDIQNLIHFGKKDGNKVLVPGGVHSTTLAVNVSEEDGLSYSHSEDLKMQTLSEDQVLVTEEDLGETTEEVKFHSSTSEIGVCQKQNPRRRRRVRRGRRRKRNLTGGQDEASKLVKRSEQPQKVQMPHTRTGCGESASDLTPCQWSESFQARHLEGNRPSKEPINCAQSTESFSPSSQLVKCQEEHNGAVTYNCPECQTKLKTSLRLNRHLVKVHHINTKYKCSDCNMCFLTDCGMRSHSLACQSVQKPFKCLKCTGMFKSILLLNLHVAKAHDVLGCVTCLECGMRFSDSNALQSHRHDVHVKRPFACRQCSRQFSSFVQLFNHHNSTHQSTFKCPENNLYFTRHRTLNERYHTKSIKNFSFTDYMKGFAVDEALDFPWEVRK